MPSTIILLTSDASFQIKFNLFIIIVTIYLHNQVESHLQLKPINEMDISTIINNFKNKASYGHDKIFNKLIKRAGPALIRSITLMVNQMLFTGIFPDSLKISKVKPLFKAGNPVLISIYRPISLLPSLSKIFEHIIFQQLFDYMTDNNLFAIEQYGFRSGHSTLLAALHLIDYLTKQMDVGEIPINIYILIYPKLLTHLITQYYWPSFVIMESVELHIN